MKLAEIAQKINKAWKASVITPGNMIPECKRFSMGTLSADHALYGGLPEGKLISLAGESGSCKSLVSNLAISRYQKKHPDKCCVYVDAEETLVGQIDWIVAMTGLDISPERFMRYDCCGKSAEEIFQDIIQLQSADDIGMIVIDSAPMLMSQADIDNEFTKDNGQRASIAKSMGKFLKIMVPAIAKAGNPLLIINHTRVVGTTYTGAKIYSEPCGYALNFYPCVKVRFATRKFTKGDKLDIAQSQTDSETDGICATFSVTKNRLGALNRNGAKIIFRFDSGVDTLTDLIEIITKYEIAERVSSMAWRLVDPFTKEPYKDEDGNDLKFVGKQKMIDYIKTHDEFRQMYEQVVSNYINHIGQDISLVDDETMKQILEMEKSVEKEMEKESKNMSSEEKAEFNDMYQDAQNASGDTSTSTNIDNNSDTIESSDINLE